MPTSSVPDEASIPRDVGEYRMLRALGQGEFGCVKLALHRPSGVKVAIKVIDKKNVTSQGNKKMITREVNIMRVLRNKYVCQLYEVMDTDTHLFIVLEYCPTGELFDFVVRRGHLNEDEARVFFRHLIEGIAYCHSRGVVHRDIKAENILIGNNNTVKISDFGLSNFFTGEDRLSTYCGSPSYVAPELVNRSPYIGPPADLWSCGVLLYVMVCGHLPFSNFRTLREMYALIRAAKYKVPSHVSPELTDLIQKLLVVDVDQRATAADVAVHPWVTVGQEAPINIKPDHFDPSTMKDEDFDDYALAHLTHRGISAKHVMTCVRRSDFRPIHSTYVLLCERRRKLTARGDPLDYPNSPAYLEMKARKNQRVQEAARAASADANGAEVRTIRTRSVAPKDAAAMHDAQKRVGEHLPAAVKEAEIRCVRFRFSVAIVSKLPVDPTMVALSTILSEIPDGKVTRPQTFMFDIQVGPAQVRAEVCQVLFGDNSSFGVKLTGIGGTEAEYKSLLATVQEKLGEIAKT